MPTSPSSTQYPLSPGLPDAVQGSTHFALDLYHLLRLDGGNLFFSPYSLTTALAMTYAGARGVTASQMASALHFPSDQPALHAAYARLQAGLAEADRSGQIQLKVANSLWPQRGYPFLHGFLALIKHYYGVAVTPVDYRQTEAARRVINSWVEERTANKINELIPPGLLDALTRLVLVNAIYFIGDWDTQFEPRLTHPAAFRLPGGEQVPVQLMYQKENFGYRSVDGLQVVELPYTGKALSMLVLLPDKVDGLDRLEDSLTPENLERWTRDLDEQKVEVFLPRFELTQPFRLDSLLQSLGMRDAFTSRADFSGMDGRRELYIGAVLHKAYVRVNEEGSQAAAATAVAVRWLCAKPVPAPIFRADHPFLFLIRENATGSLLFLGRLVASFKS
jgi:serpin B